MPLFLQLSQTLTGKYTATLHQSLKRFLSSTHQSYGRSRLLFSMLTKENSNLDSSQSSTKIPTGAKHQARLQILPHQTNSALASRESTTYLSPALEKAF